MIRGAKIPNTKLLKKNKEQNSNPIKVVMVAAAMVVPHNFWLVGRLCVFLYYNSNKLKWKK